MPITLSTPEIFLNFLLTMSQEPNTVNNMMQDIYPSALEATQTDIVDNATSSTPPLKHIKTTTAATEITPLAFSSEITIEFSPKSGDMGLSPSNPFLTSPDDSVKTTVEEKLPVLAPEPTGLTN